MHMSNRTDNITSLSKLWCSYWRTTPERQILNMERSLSRRWSWRTRQREWLYKPPIHGLCAVWKQLFVLDITHVCTMKLTRIYNCAIWHNRKANVIRTPNALLCLCICTHPTPTPTCIRHTSQTHVHTSLPKWRKDCTGTPSIWKDLVCAAVAVVARGKSRHYSSGAVVVWIGMAPHTHIFEYLVTREWHC